MRKCNTFKIYKLQNNNQGVASIVVAVLLIGLLFTFLSYIQMNQIPDWTEEREAEREEGRTGNATGVTQRPRYPYSRKNPRY